MLTIVTYHYVRDLPRTRFPEIRGLATGRFEGQLDYLTKHYTFCHPDEVLAAVRGETVLPPNGCLLTFDDGLCDHYTTVFPRLEERGIPAVFFPAARPIGERTMLEVHMIHFVLASVPDPRRLVAETLNLVDQHRATHALPDRATLFRVCGAANRFDTLEVSFLKRLLQRELPALVRRDICRVLFQRHVTADLTSFAAELYMDLAQLRCLARNGMAIGGHGDVHDWLELLGPSEQREEIRQTLSLLESVAGQRPANWIMVWELFETDAGPAAGGGLRGGANERDCVGLGPCQAVGAVPAGHQRHPVRGRCAGERMDEPSTGDRGSWGRAGGLRTDC